MVHSGKIKFLLYVVSDVFKGFDKKNDNFDDNYNISSEDIKKESESEEDEINNNNNKEISKSEKSINESINSSENNN